MQVLQKITNLSVAGNRQNALRLTLYFASGSVPDDLSGAVYYGEDTEAVTALAPVFTPLTSRNDAAFIDFTQEQMAQISEYSNLYLELSYGGMAQTRGTLKSDSRTESSPADRYLKLHTFGGEEIGVAIDEALSQVLSAQEDVVTRQGQIEDIQDDVTAKQSAAATSAQNAATSEENAAASESNAATSEQNASTSAQNAATSEENAAASESNAATSEQNASTSAQNAATSEENAAASESNAATSESNAIAAIADTLQAKVDAIAARDAAIAAATNYVARPGSNVNTAYTINMALKDNQFHYLNLNGNTTFTINGIADGRAVWLRLVQTGAGGFLPTFPASVKWPGGASPDINLTAGGVTIVTLVANSDGTVDGTYAKM